MAVWRFTGIYGFPETENKHKTGVLLNNLNNLPDIPWLVGGDLNLMLWSMEKQGGVGFDFAEATILRETLDKCKLGDLGYVGYQFTWSNNREDRVHAPKKKKRVKIFRFEEIWLREESCGDVIRQAWEGGGDISHNIKRTAANLGGWSKAYFGNFAKEMGDCKAGMAALMEKEPSPENIAQMKAIDERMDELEEREEVFWKQRSRQEWLKSGDKNSKFFHTKAQQRRKRNAIVKIKDEAGNIYKDEDHIAEVWRLLTNSHSLMSRTLKQKYFPNAELMEAKIPVNASFTWRSLMSARNLVSKGARKLIGKGLSTEIWKHPWVPTLPNFRVLYRHQQPAEHAPTYVADLISDGDWNLPLLNSYFLQWEVNEITKIPVARFGDDESWTWHFTKSGDFSVRSAYHAMIESKKHGSAASSSPPNNAI
uniref:Uncharacterized protein n=1 Tax=Chenopodium quinoa TaxID=63459 RepID=A0A803MJ30_CHEQI